MRIGLHTLALSAALLSGCDGGSAFDGTWIFLIDYEPARETGDCVDEDDATSYSGTQNSWVDIYTNGGDGIAVMFDDGLMGTFDGSTFDASTMSGVTYEDYISYEGLDMSAELDSNVLTGEFTEWEEETDGDDTYNCDITYTFTAEKQVTDVDEYAGD